MKNQDHNSTSKVVPGVDDLQLLAANSSVDAAEAVSESSNPTKPSPDQEYSATLEDFADIKSSDATNATKKQRKNRRIWTHQEDAVLLQIIQNHSFQDQKSSHWADIATKLNSGRTGKQCRDRWQCQLRPHIKKGAWTKEEEDLICQMHASFGTKWSCMAKLMKNRTDNDIKNKWYSMVRKEKRTISKQKSSGGDSPPATKPPAEFATSIDTISENRDFHFPDVPTPTVKHESIPNQAYLNSHNQQTVSDKQPQPRSGEFHLLPNCFPTAAHGWSFGNPFGQHFTTIFHPQQRVTDFGSLMLVDQSGKPVEMKPGGIMPGKYVGFPTTAESPRLTDAGLLPGVAFGSLEAGNAPSPQMNYMPVMTSCGAQDGTLAPDSSVPDGYMMYRSRCGDNTNELITSGVEMAKSGGTAYNSVHTMSHMDHPGWVYSIPCSGTTSGGFGGTKASNLDILANVGLAGGHMDTSPVAHRGGMSSPIVSSVKRENVASSIDSTMPDTGCLEKKLSSNLRNVKQEDESTGNDVAMSDVSTSEDN